MRRAAILLALPQLAIALPRAGDAIPAVEVVDVDGKTRALADPRRALLIFYEDKDAGAQNRRARALLGPITDRADNRARFELVAVADVEKWDFWPARKYVIDELRATERREQTRIWCDWKGRVRRALGLTRGKSGVVLVGGDGRCRFAGEGPLTDAQIADLMRRLDELGVIVK